MFLSIHMLGQKLKIGMISMMILELNHVKSLGWIIGLNTWYDWYTNNSYYPSVGQNHDGQNQQ